jgi:hypothetical protein
VKTFETLGRAIVVSIATLSVAGCLGDGQETSDSATGGNNDGGGTTTTPPSSTPTNHAPTISGSPATNVKVGSAYTYQPVASDVDGDSLTFSIANKPSWATFSATTGKLSGTPADGSNGTFADVQITVSDGQASASTSPFDITVSALVIGSATLNWQPPTENEDGTALTNLAGYVVHYGNDAGNLGQTLSLPNPGLTTAVIDDLVEGTWYFSLSSVNSSGVESSPTGVVSTTIG